VTQRFAVNVEVVTRRIDVLLSAADDIHLRMAAEKLELPGKPVRKRYVVRVHSGDEIATSQSQHLIEPRDITRIGAAPKPNARIAGRIALEDRQGTVRRAVVDDQELEVAERLAEDALDGLGDVRQAAGNRLPGFGADDETPFRKGC
jgi:hypothetical protein